MVLTGRNAQIISYKQLDTSTLMNNVKLILMNIRPQKNGDKENQLTKRVHVFCGLKKICSFRWNGVPTNLTPPFLGGGVIFFKWSKFIFSQFFAALNFWFFCFKSKIPLAGTKEHINNFIGVISI